MLAPTAAPEARRMLASALHGPGRCLMIESSKKAPNFQKGSLSTKYMVALAKRDDLRASSA
eukprot:CAMPEP_0180519682 /NCGR_PEP_ID=MMETSP1036_2-20121128/55834_1 /TAXON_ID=632150 /ORGANISM="Azadinium spinosum, Strain 3D9" /LENGTH=60 /DNA_ID=CAMNT_0022532069 /DNA_START=125 /DNA_END=307 /DNA_ORIENTATION=-